MSPANLKSNVKRAETTLGSWHSETTWAVPSSDISTNNKHLVSLNPELQTCVDKIILPNSMQTGLKHDFSHYLIFAFYLRLALYSL